ncbi:MAG: family 16 glycoside hydrolase [Janthinobacterium lividum]
MIGRWNIGMVRGIAPGLLSAVMLVAATPAVSPVRLAMTASGWETKGDARFVVDTAYPEGVLDLGHASATSKGLTFTDGTIDFDVKLTGAGILGIKFRDMGHRAAEVFYMRPQPHCATSDDCIQYMPFENGAYEWDEYPEYQAKAPLDPIGWNHVRLVVSGRRMNVFVNGATTPTLAVGRLAGDAHAGAISLSGPARYANVTVRPGLTDGLAPQPEPDQTAVDPRYVRRWRTAGPATLASREDPTLKVPTGVDPGYRRMPSVPAAWTSTKAQDKGIVDMSRALGSSSQGSVISLGWARTVIVSDRDQMRHASFGWLREAWVYVNGRRVFAGRNLYGTPASRGPDGRLSLDDGAFGLPLRKGRNEVVVALDDNFSGEQHFGWGFAMRLDSITGLHMDG